MTDGSPSTTSHRAQAGGAFGFGLLTVSDTRRPDTDASGATMRELVEGAGHRVHASAIVPDEPDLVRAAVLAWTKEPGCDVVVTSGGTGLSARDRRMCDEIVERCRARGLPRDGWRAH